MLENVSSLTGLRFWMFFFYQYSVPNGTKKDDFFFFLQNRQFFIPHLCELYGNFFLRVFVFLFLCACALSVNSIKKIKNYLITNKIKKNFPNNKKNPKKMPIISNFLLTLQIVVNCLSKPLNV